MIKYIVIAFIAFSIIFTDSAFSLNDQYVRGYYRQNGKYVKPYRRTYKNDTFNDNYSTRGNINPYTGKWGTHKRDEDYRYQPMRKQRRHKW